MKCYLCKKNTELKESHIIPKFIFRWMRETSGGSYLRNAGNYNIRHQDGLKQYLFCNDCEKKLNVGETYFSKNIFYPYLDKSKSNFIYNHKLFYFIISVLWRVLLLNSKLLKESNIDHKELFLKAEEEWRKYLLGGTDSLEFNNIHIIFTEIRLSNNLPSVFLNRYLTRVTDGALLYTSKSATIYSKFSKFIILGRLLERPNMIYQNTKIINGNGTLNSNQVVNDSNLFEFIIERATEINNMIQMETSEQQKEKIRQWGFDNLEKFANSEVYQALEADYGSRLSDDLFSKNKVHRNDYCPCGSGKKYKYCHGK